MSERYAESERSELRRHSEVRQRGHLPGLDLAVAEQAVGKPVLPPVEDAVHTAEHRGVPLRDAAARQAFRVEVRAENQREQDEPENRPRRAERGEECGI